MNAGPERGTGPARWWLTAGEKAEGPFPADHVAEWLKSGQISPDTLACEESGKEWRRLHEIPFFAGFTWQSTSAPTAPHCPPGMAAISWLVTPPVAPGTFQAKFGILTAAIVLSAVGLALELLAAMFVGAFGIDSLSLCASIASGVTWLVYHYQLWAMIPPEYAETTPGRAVGFLFIPFYNFYWIFQSTMGVARGLNRCAEPGNTPEPGASVGLATAYSVTWIATLVIGGLMGFAAGGQIEPGDVDAEQGLLVCSVVFLSVPAFIFWLLMVLNQKQSVERLLTAKARVNTASGLLEPRA